MPRNKDPHQNVRARRGGSQQPPQEVAGPSEASLIDTIEQDDPTLGPFTRGRQSAASARTSPKGTDGGGKSEETGKMTTSTSTSTGAGGGGGASKDVPLEVYETAMGDLERLLHAAQQYMVDKILATLLTIVCAFTRFYNISNPPGVVFDEFHFGRFQNQYCRGEYFFDVSSMRGE